MANIFDYMAWRGDLSITQDGFNEVDNLILSRFSYLPMDGIVPNSFSGAITIGTAAEQFAYSKKLHNLLVLQEDKHLFEAIGKCPRFANLRLYSYTNIISIDEEKQFSAVCIDLGNGSLFLSYRGTDNTLVGWKEDFNMSFLREIPAQKDAVAYLENVALNFDGPIIVGGHSKGGNLAIYASAFCNKQTQDKIIRVYNNDGPGLHGDVIRKPGYIAIQKKIHTFIPQASIVGILLEHNGYYTVIRSAGSGPFQHDLYSWEIIGPRFIHLESITDSSKFVDNTVKSWLAEWNEEEREKFVEALYQIMGATGAKTFQEMGEKWYNSAIIMLKTFIALDDNMKKAVSSTLRLLMRSAGKHISYITPSIPFIGPSDEEKKNKK